MSKKLYDNMGQYLYHYSDRLFDKIESKAKQLDISKKQLDEDYKIEVLKYCSPNVYSKNISLFIDPIPIKTIASIFNHKHKVWVSGKELYQYSINVDNIPKDIEYSVVETPSQNKMLEDTFYDWPTDENSKEYDEYLRNFKCKKLRMMKKNGEVGVGRDKLLEVIKPYIGEIENYYKKAQTYMYLKDPELLEGLYTKYAQGVPHIMIYPESGEIEYTSVKKVRIA